ncbi:type IV secretory system conjugative DNA transfer family protein [Trinickia fusca]|uniref:TraD/TraG TraM recognition site domain-containing protein n=1 Tax=Trinickia fusca TaxID=2419777 RepID=A0A494XJ09_9BURK|nr:hypothetical protein [Trinickia fusca]RKP47543.1 hypothetical protein D7S89_15050 [Trinickia fusca]
MAQKYGTSRWQEIDQQRITLDPRTLTERFSAWLKGPRNYAKFQISMAVAACVLAFAWLPITFAMVMAHLWFKLQRHTLPMRYPKDLGGIDPSLDVEKPNPNGKGEIVERRPADGILYLGNQRSPDRTDHLQELWATNDDARTHMLLMGTTGSGKTVTLLSLCFNALSWGSGFFYSDGKADSSLHAAVWALCRRVGREDDYLVLNFMTGGADPYKQRKSTEKSSNGTNPWYEGGPDFLSQLSSALLPKASGDGAQWQQKAVNMMDALIRTLCYERAVGNITLSIGVIREYLSLPNLVKLYLKGKRGEIPEFAFLPIKAYLETGLPGFRPEYAEKPEKWDQTVWDQHGYLTGQYARTLSMLMDTYGAIFKDKYSEVDMMDVLLNRRVLVVMIPTLEKSSQEAANLGKLIVSSIRLMMAMNLGHKLEGTYADIIDTKATKSPAPYIITMDELGYYFAEGIALMFAQARSLGFMMIAAGQDIAAMAKGDNKEEVDSMIANTKIKYSLALEDPDKTLEVFRKVAGESISVEVGSFEGSVNHFTSAHYRRNMTGSIQRRDRIDLQELKALKEMEGVLIFKDQVTRARSFTWFHSVQKTKLPFRLNRFLQVDRPARVTLGDKLRKIEGTGKRTGAGDRIAKSIRLGQAPAYPPTRDPILDAMRATYRDIETHNPTENAVNRGIAYYVAAVEAMRAHRADDSGRYWRPAQVAQAVNEQGFERADESTAPDASSPQQENKEIEAPLSPPPSTPPYVAAPLETADTLSIADVPHALEESGVADTVDVSEPPSVPVPEVEEEDVRPTIERNPVYYQPPLCEKPDVSDPQRTVIGFTDKTIEALAEVEEALGRDDPLASVKAMEAQIASHLTWTQPGVPLTDDEWAHLFGRIEATMGRLSSEAAR